MRSAVLRIRRTKGIWTLPGVELRSSPAFSLTVWVEVLLPVVSDFMGSHSGAPSPGEQRVPVDQVLNGLEVHALESGETALEAFILLKVLDRDGDISWSYRTTNRLSREELLGALTVQVDVLRKSLRDEWDDT